MAVKDKPEDLTDLSVEDVVSNREEGSKEGKVAIEVDIGKKPDAEVAAQAGDRKPPPASPDGETIKSFTNQFHGYRRITEKMQRQMEEIQDHLLELANRPHQAFPQSQAAPPGSLEAEAEKLVNDGRWQEAINKLADARFQTHLAALEERRAFEDRQRQAVETMDSAKRRVLDRYPELDPRTGDEEASVSQLYREVLNQHPEYLTNNLGPILAMRDAEDLAQERGIALSARETRNGENQDRERKIRAREAAVPVSRGRSTEDKVPLSQDQKEFADYHGIPLETYARSVKKSRGGEGVSYE